MIIGLFDATVCLEVDMYKAINDSMNVVATIASMMRVLYFHLS